MAGKVVQGLYPILYKAACARQTYDMLIECPELAGLASAGQFVHVKVDGFTLRRPVSICETNGKTIRLVFEVRGEGTEKLAQLPAGGMIDLMGPLGNGFSLPEGKILLAGGGIGVPPLLQAAREGKGRCTAVLGFRSAPAVILEDDFQKAGCRVCLCTDDGTMGRKGLVTQPLEELLGAPGSGYAAVLACGPLGMLRGVAALAKQYGVPCQVSLEERMGCGIGACLVCACKVRRADGSDTYAHVCKDGPVFDAERVVF